MTVSSAVSKLSYNGDGTLTPRATPQFVSNSDIIAILRDAAGLETTWVENTDYTLIGAGVPAGGTLTPIATAPAVGEKLIIFRDPPIVQGSKFPIGGPFPSPTVEAAVDLLTFVCQRLNERVDRTLNFPETDTLLNTELPSVDLRKNKFFGFDTAGNPTAVAGTSANLGPVSAYIDTLLSAATAAAARSILVSQEDVITTRGDLVVGNATPIASRLAAGAVGTVLAGGIDPSYVASTSLVVALPRSYLAGLVLSNNSGDATDSIDIAVGAARDTADTANLTVATAIGKDISATWATGGTTATPTGGMSSNLHPVQNDTWYHVILGLVSGTVEVGFDTSLTGANLVTDHSFTNTRRIGSVRRGTATNLAFVQLGDHFQWVDPPEDINLTNTLTTTARLDAISVPLGIKTLADVSTIGVDSIGAIGYVSSPDANDEAPSIAGAPGHNIGLANQATAGGHRIWVRTDTSSQVRSRSDTATMDTYILTTFGYIDTRGRVG